MNEKKFDRTGEKDASMGLILLDVDGTMFPDTPNEFTGVAYDYMIRNNLLARGSNEEITTILSLRERYSRSDDLTTRRLYFDPLNQAFDRQIAGRSRAHVDRMADEIVAERLEDAFPVVLREIRAKQEQGHPIGLISGSPNFLIQALKRAIKADIATGTRFYASGGGIYHPTRSTSPRGRNKDRIAEGMLTRLSQRRLQLMGSHSVKASLDEFDDADKFELAVAFGDTIHDLGMLEKAHQPVVVKPKPDLRDIAEQRQWRIIDQPE